LQIVIEQRFDHFHGKGAFVRLRSMLNDPRFAYQHIANKFGLTRQYIAQKKVPRIGIYRRLIQLLTPPLPLALREHGYIEGQNIAIE
jgi:hypothetical protein